PPGSLALLGKLERRIGALHGGIPVELDQTPYRSSHCSRRGSARRPARRAANEKECRKCEHRDCKTTRQDPPFPPRTCNRAVALFPCDRLVDLLQLCLGGFQADQADARVVEIQDR